MEQGCFITIVNVHSMGYYAYNGMQVEGVKANKTVHFTKSNAFTGVQNLMHSMVCILKVSKVHYQI